jgi:outer membrane protein assembly factor BamB
MNKSSLYIFAILLLSGCASSGKIKSIVDFTPKLTQEASGYKVILPQAEHAKPWTQGTGWVNAQPSNFAAQADGKLAKYKAASSQIIAAPLIVDGKVFTLSAKGILSAMDDISYKTLWSADLKTKSISSVFSGGGMTYRDGVLFLTHTTRDIIAYDAVLGRELWRRQLPDVTKAQPVLHNNMALVLTISNQLYAIDITNGRIIWQNDGLAETISPNRNVAPIIHNDKVIVGYSSGQLMILNLASGEELWQMNLSREGDDVLPGFIPVGLESQPIIDGNTMYVASGNGLLLKLSLENGSIIWQKKVPDVQAMNKSGNSLFVVTNAKQVAALDASTGQVAWATDLDPQVVTKKKKTQKPAQFLTPLVINNELFVISSDGKIHELSPETGAIIKVKEIEKGAQFVAVSEGLNIFTKQSVLKAE